MDGMGSLLIWQEKKKFKTLAVSRPNWQKGALGVLGERWQQNPVGRAVENGPTEKVS